MQFYDKNPIPVKFSNKCLKIQSSKQTSITKENTPIEVKFLPNYDPTSAKEQQIL